MKTWCCSDKATSTAPHVHSAAQEQQRRPSLQGPLTGQALKSWRLHNPSSARIFDLQKSLSYRLHFCLLYQRRSLLCDAGLLASCRSVSSPEQQSTKSWWRVSSSVAEAQAKACLLQLVHADSLPAGRSFYVFYGRPLCPFSSVALLDCTAAIHTTDRGLYDCVTKQLRLDQGLILRDKCQPGFRSCMPTSNPLQSARGLLERKRRGQSHFRL